MTTPEKTERKAVLRYKGLRSKKIAEIFFRFFNFVDQLHLVVFATPFLGVAAVAFRFNYLNSITCKCLDRFIYTRAKVFDFKMCEKKQ